MKKSMLRRIKIWTHDITDDPTIYLPIVPLNIGDSVVRALSLQQKRREERVFKHGFRMIGNAASYMHNPNVIYVVRGFRNGGVLLEGFCSTVSAKYLRKVTESHVEFRDGSEKSGGKLNN